jgi:hypothetical protein
MGQIHVYIIFSIPMKILLFIDPVTAFSSLPGIPNWKFVTITERPRRLEPRSSPALIPALISTSRSFPAVMVH